MKPINILIATGEMTKNVTIAEALHKPEREANQYDRFGYESMTIFYHTWGQVLGSMYADPINMIHTSQKSIKYVLNEQLKGY